MTKKLPLTGVRVLDLSHVIAGPMASFYLAQLGAEVIKIETPAGGDVMRSSKAGQGEGDTPTGFVTLNAGKKSLAIDIREPEGHETVRALAADADVFIENFRPGVVAKYGLDYESIKAVNPDVIYCSISGYGQSGEWAGRGAYDHVVQALTGMMMMSGDSPDAPPLKVGFPVIDVAAGLLGALSVVSALHQRNQDGTGTCIDASMIQAAMTLMYPNASAFLSQGIEPQRVGNRGYTGSPTADTYRCNDGWLSTAANTPSQFRRLVGVLGLEHLCEDGDAIDLQAFNAPGGGFVVARNLPYLREQFNAAFAQYSAHDMEQKLNAVGVPAARVRKLGEFLNEVQSDSLISLPIQHYSQGDRTVTTPGIGFRYVGKSTHLRVGAPSLGQHTEELLQELGQKP